MASKPLLEVKENARSIVENQYTSRIIELESQVKEDKRRYDSACLHCADLRIQLENAYFSNMPPSVYQKLQNRLTILSDSITDLERNLITIEHKLSSLNRDIAIIDEILETSEEQEEITQQNTRRNSIQASITELEELQSDTRERINTLSQKCSDFRADMEQQGLSYADQDFITQLLSEISAAEHEKETSARKKQQDEVLLADQRGKLFVDNSDLAKINKQYMDALAAIEKETLTVTPNEALLLRQPVCRYCGKKLQPTNKNGIRRWYCPTGISTGKWCNSGRQIDDNEVELFEHLLALKAQRDRIKEIDIPKNSAKFCLPQEKFKDYIKKTATYIAYPESFSALSPTSFVFQSIAVPDEIFEEREANNIRILGYFYISILDQQKDNVPITNRTLYSLALRLLNRGHVLVGNKKRLAKLKDKFNHKESGTLNSLLNYAHYLDPEVPLNTEKREVAFAKRYLPTVLGNAWVSYTIFQAGFDFIMPSSDEFHDQRVDMLVTKGGKIAVIEIDGPEHQQHANNDRARDEALDRNRIKVFRFSNDQVDQDDPVILQSLQEFFTPDNEKQKVTSIDDKYLVATKLQHQFAIAIIKSLEQGALSCRENLHASISTQLFTEAEAQYILALAIDEIQDILEAYADIYNIELDFNLLDPSIDQTEICVGDGLANSQKRHVLIRDCYWLNSLHSPIEPFTTEVFPQKASRTTLEFFLNYIFGFNHFRDGQYEAIQRLLLHNDSIILLPTGAGKSIIYQLTSYIVPGLTIVISPLKALIQDQRNNLDYKNGINNVIAVYSVQDENEKDSMRQALSLIKHSSISLLYIAPERLLVPSFRNEVSIMMEHNMVSTIAIDEAHCVSEWGHDFRPAYMKIATSTKLLFSKNGFTPTLFALTGTASKHVLEDVKACLDIEDPKAIIMPKSFDRPELNYILIRCPSKSKTHSIANIIKNILPARFGISYSEMARLNGDQTYSGIVFTPNASSTQPSEYAAMNVSRKLTNSLPEMGISRYFSKLPDGYEQKTWELTIRMNAEQYKKNQINLLVATKAFGMGIDKENIRFIIHDGIPSSLEQYYQEAGRAGRGRDKSLCVILFSDDYCKENEKYLNPNMTYADVEKAYKNHPQMRGHDDDLSKVLFFHFSAYKGIESECVIADEVLSIIENSSRSGETTCHLALRNYYKYNIDAQPESEKSRLEAVAKCLGTTDQDKSFMIAITRLAVLGIVKDYQYDYSQKEFEISVESFSRKTITQHYIDYVTRYEKQRAREARNTMAELSDYGFSKSALRVLISFMYEKMEKARRAAIENMYQTVKNTLNRPETEQENFFRDELLNYLTTDEDRVDQFEKIFSEQNAGIKLIQDLITIPNESNNCGTDQVNEYRKIHAQISRMYESYPEHPTLLLILALCEMVYDKQHSKQIADKIIAAISSARDKYMISDQVLQPTINLVLNSALDCCPNTFVDVMNNIKSTKVSKEAVIGSMLKSRYVSNSNRDYIILDYLSDRIKNMI